MVGFLFLMAMGEDVYMVVYILETEIRCKKENGNSKKKKKKPISLPVSLPKSAQYMKLLSLLFSCVCHVFVLCIVFAIGSPEM